MTQSPTKNATTRKPPRPLRKADSEGLAARDCAASALFSVFVEKRAFDDAFNQAAERRNLAARDRAFARLVATTVLRQRGALSAVIARFLQKPLPENRGRLEPILLAAAAQLLVLKTPPHAAISLAVDQCRADNEARRFDKLANAVLRRVNVEGPAIWASLNTVELNIPSWLIQRWVNAYGAPTAHDIANASLAEPYLDLSVATDIEHWHRMLGGTRLLDHTIRLVDAGRIENLPGYDHGAWWVQDIAASLPALLLGDVRGQRVADLCAAPGGKTAQLAARGALVTAIDKSPGRLKRLTQNLDRLKLSAETLVADASTFTSTEPFDGLLIDAPCTATGTIRRHPDILHLKREDDVAALATVQANVLAQAARNVRVGGTIVYCTCSLEPEEGEHQINAFLTTHPNFTRHGIESRDVASNAADVASWITPGGDLRTLPHYAAATGDIGQGMDGFFAARLIRRS